MSRIGKNPIDVPSGVTITLNGNHVTVKGPKGELARDIPDWGPQKAEQLLSFGEKQFGLTRDYMQNVTDVNLIKVMNFAFLAAKANPSKTAPAAPKPAAKVKGGTVPSKGVDDRLSPDDWLKARNAQVRNRA